ncbi:hypothetical protein QCA50_008200 [Cerrena zonata]|uniref:Uncharacterized protein n=1 Tax=Cerrena zonata TaxID=2478898 RepID=A0AAW0GFD7_9APHY
MAPLVYPGEPKESPKPEPIGNTPILILFTVCTLCAIFLLWRRASAIKAVVGHQLKTWSKRGGTIRLSMDDGPTAREFLDGDYDDDNADIADDEPLALRAQQLHPKPAQNRNDRTSLRLTSETSMLFEVDEDDTPPPPPPKK